MILDTCYSCSYGLAPRLAERFLSQQSWSTQISSQPQLPNSVFSISSCSKLLPNSAFYANEKCMNFPGNEDRIDISVNKFSNIDSKNQEKFDNIPKETIESGEQVSFHSNQNACSFNKSVRDRLTKILDQNGVGTSMFSSPLVQKHSPKLSYETIPKPAVLRKRRIRWTHDLHDQFVECVNLLGGPAKATPKGILKLMGVNGMTILHVKSHLQKYRVARYIPESAEGKFEGDSENSMSQLEPKLGMQIIEAQRVQIEVQKTINEQLKIQRELLLSIEKQGKQLKRMLCKKEKQTRPCV